MSTQMQQIESLQATPEGSSKGFQAVVTTGRAGANYRWVYDEVRRRINNFGDP